MHEATRIDGWTIQFLTWGLHDDLFDHPVKLTRQQWNYVQRLRLILQSKAEIRRDWFWKFRPVHWVGIPALVVLGMIWLRYGTEIEFLGVDVMLGVVFLIVR